MLPFELIKDTPYLALSGELWSVFYEYFNRNWSCYRGFLLYLVQILSFYLESIKNYRTDKPNFPEFKVKMAKMTLKVKVNDPYFQYQPRVSQDACLVQFWWF